MGLAVGRDESRDVGVAPGRRVEQQRAHVAGREGSRRRAPVRRAFSVAAAIASS